MNIFTNKPWQFWVIVVFYVGLSLMSVIRIIMFLTAYVGALMLAHNMPANIAFLKSFPWVLVLAIVSIIAVTLFIRSLFSGNKFSLLLGILGVAWLVLMSISSFGHAVVNKDFKSVMLQMIGLLILVLVEWFNVQCLKHPFYGGNGKISVDTFKFWKRGRGSEEMTTF